LLCSVCASTVIRWTQDGNPIAFGHYGGALASTLLRLKYGNRPDLGAALGELLCPVVLSHLDPSEIDVVVPVPVPYSRLATRGYNQAALIARPLVSSLHARFEPRALCRRETSVRQATLNRNERLSSAQEAFTLRKGKSMEGQRVLLVDDVSTTGATLAACRALLESAGAQIVHTAVVARTESRGL
jgi:ComF family protein